MSARSRAQYRLGVTAPLVSGPPQPYRRVGIIPSSCLGVLGGSRCADQMRARRPVPITIIALQASCVLGFLVRHPTRRVLAGRAGHPVVEVAARLAHGEVLGPLAARVTASAARKAGARYPPPAA